MNYRTIANSRKETKGFRPQQGLTIMNNYREFNNGGMFEFPSPTGVNYYESLPTKP